jgi:hypothetical protein
MKRKIVNPELKETVTFIKTATKTNGAGLQQALEYARTTAVQPVGNSGTEKPPICTAIIAERIKRSISIK